MSSRKYKFHPSEFFSMSVRDLWPGKDREFPLYIYFQKNDHLILRSASDSDMTEHQLNDYVRIGLEKFWIPVEYRGAVDAYLLALENQEGEARLIEEALEILSDQARSDEAAEAIDVLTAKEANEEEKAECLKDIGERVIGTLSALGDNATPEEVEKAIQKCREFTEDIIRVAAKATDSGAILEELERVRELELGHSTTTSTFATILALSLGYSDQSLLCDIAFGALLHDIGYILIDPKLLQVPETKLSPEELAAFQLHVPRGLEFLEKKNMTLPAAARQVIEQHHESYDGTGYPKRLPGLDISDCAQVVAMADLLDELMSGHFDGVKRSPAQAFTYFSGLQRTRSAKISYHPELYESVVQALARGKDKQLKHSALAQNVESVLEKQISGTEAA